MRQGFPLPPLIFLIFMEALNCMIKEALNSNRLKGLEFEEIGQSMAHQIFANNTIVIIKAEKGQYRYLY